MTKAEIKSIKEAIETAIRIRDRLSDDECSFTELLRQKDALADLINYAEEKLSEEIEN